MTGCGGGIEHACDGLVDADSDQIDARGHRGACDDVAEFEDGSEQACLTDLDRSALARLSKDEQQLLRTMPELTLIHDLNTDRPREHVGRTVEHDDDGAQQTHVEREGASDCDSDGLSPRDGEVLRCHLPHDHVQEHHDAERDPDRDGDARTIGQGGAGQQRLERASDRGLSDRTEAQRCEGDAELSTREGDGQLTQRSQGRDCAHLTGLGPALDHATTCGEQ